MPERRIERVLKGRITMDGAGVRVRRAFGTGTEGFMDPFLLLDEVASRDPADYIAGFPLHPHRGMDTLTYMIAGFFRHTDSLGNTGMLGPGDIEWVTAGSGILHEEMPLESAYVQGFQIWINLPRAEKMKDPVYRGGTAEEVPIVPIKDGKVKVIAGVFGGARGPIVGVPRGPELLDIQLGSRAYIEPTISQGRTAFLYVFEGTLLQAGDTRLDRVPEDTPETLLLSDGDYIHLSAGDEGARFLLAVGDPIRESIAWKGPIVMNTPEELDLAYREYSRGTFLKVR